MSNELKYLAVFIDEDDATLEVVAFDSLTEAEEFIEGLGPLCQPRIIRGEEIDGARA